MADENTEVGMEPNIGESLKRFRNEFHLKQSDVANALGMLQPYYTKYETGKVRATAAMIYKLAKIYDVSADYLLGLSNVPINPTVTDADTELIDAIIACHKALHDVLEKRGLKEK